MPLLLIPGASGPYATQVDLENRLGRSLAANRATSALVDATAKIDAYCGGSLWQATVTEERLRATGSTRLYLPGPPTLAVTNVQVTYEPLRVPNPVYYVLSPSLYALRLATNQIERLDGNPWAAGVDVLVDRTRGFSPGLVPPRLVAITCGLAGRLLEVPSGITQEQLGDHTISYAVGVSAPNKARELTDEERADLDLWSYTAGELYR